MAATNQLRRALQDKMASLTNESPASSSANVLKDPAVRRLLVIALLAEIAYAVLNISTMPVYLPAPVGHNKFIAEGRDLGTSVVGIVLAAFLLSEAIFKSPMGTLADRIGQRRLMFLGPAITACTSILTLVIPIGGGIWEVLALVILRIADGVGAAMMWPAAFALMGSLVREDQRQQAMSYLNLCYMVGIALALPIGGAVNVAFGHTYASLFLSSILFVGVALAVFKFVPSGKAWREAQRTKQTETSTEAGFGDFIRALHTIPTFLLLAIVTFAGIGFPMAVVKPFAAAEFGMNELAFGGLVFPAAITLAALSVPLSRVGERMGKARAVHVGMGACAVGLSFMCLGAFFPIFRAGWTLALGGIPVGIGFLLAIPAWMASVSDIDPERRGANIGAVMTAQGIGAIIGAPIGSTLFEKFRLFGDHVARYSPFIGCAICVTIGWLLSMKLLRDPKTGTSS